MIFQVVLWMDVPPLENKPRRYSFDVEADTADSARNGIDFSGEWFTVPDAAHLIQVRTSHIAIIEVSQSAAMKPPTPGGRFTRTGMA